MMSGTTGWLPVAMTTWSAVRLVAGRDLQGPRPGEAGVAEEDGRVLAMGPVVLAAGEMGSIRPKTGRGCPSSAPRPAWRRCRSGAGGDGVGDVGGVDEHLGGDAADVQAGAAEGAALDDRHLLVLEVRRDEGVAGAGPDDREVEVRHAVQPRASLPLDPSLVPSSRRPGGSARDHPADLVVLHAPTPQTWWFCISHQPLLPLRRRLATLLPVPLSRRPRPRRRLPALLGACGLVLGIAACGGGAATSRPRLPPLTRPAPSTSRPTAVVPA